MSQPTQPVLVPIENWADKVNGWFQPLEGAIVAYSGGVDSGLLAYMAHLALEDRMIAVMADSPSLSRREYGDAMNFADQHHIPIQIVQTKEMGDSHYLANRADRCYHCKKALFEELLAIRKQVAKRQASMDWPIVYGANMDDLSDHRPGMQAARDAGVQAPYIELGIDKTIIRDLCALYHLEIHAKPAMPCLASRLAYGEPVTIEKLSQVEAAENFLQDRGFDIVRVRHHGDLARIEVPTKDFHRLLSFKAEVSQKFHDLGFVYISLDIDGFRSGSLNAVLRA